MLRFCSLAVLVLFAADGLAAEPRSPFDWTSVPAAAPAVVKAADPQDDVMAGKVVVLCAGVPEPKAKILGVKLWSCKASAKSYPAGYHVAFLLDGKPVSVPIDKPAEAIATVKRHTSPASCSACPNCSGCDCGAAGCSVLKSVTSGVPVKGHSHKCDKCATVWSHPDGDPAASHNCPTCGTSQYRQHESNIVVSSNSAKPRRVVSKGLYYDLYPDGRMVPCAACNAGR